MFLVACMHKSCTRVVQRHWPVLTEHGPVPVMWDSVRTDPLSLKTSKQANKQTVIVWPAGASNSQAQ